MDGAAGPAGDGRHLLQRPLLQGPGARGAIQGGVQALQASPGMVWYGGGDLAGQAPPTDGGREEKVEGRRGKGSWALEGERETALSPDMVWMDGGMDGWMV